MTKHEAITYIAALLYHITKRLQLGQDYWYYELVEALTALSSQEKEGV